MHEFIRDLFREASNFPKTKFKPIHELRETNKQTNKQKQKQEQTKRKNNQNPRKTIRTYLFYYP